MNNITTFTDLLENNPSERERLASYAVKENPNMKDFSDFEAAFKRAFGKDSRGQGVIDYLNDDESKLLFESKIVQRTIKENVGEEGYETALEEEDRYEVQRDRPKGQRTKVSEIRVVRTSPERRVQTKEYVRSGRTIKPYNRGFAHWTPAQARFIQVRKEKKISTREIVREYNAHFKESARSKSSISTKIYRS